MGAFRTHLDRARSRGLSTFVGRDRDTAVLEAGLERARTGNGQVVGVVAEAGTGKSRLCAEFLDGCRARGIPVLEGRGVAHGKSIPMLPMLELWRAFYEIGEGDTPETTREKIAGRLLLMDEGFREVLPLLFDVFGVPDPANPSPAMDAEQRQKRLHGTVKRLLHDPAYGGGTRVILLEDLHWFDGASDALLETIVDSVPASRDLWLVNFRPEYQARWMQRSYYQHLPLQPLGPEAIRALLRDQLGDDPSVAALPATIHERTKGNPFFIEEVVQSLVESGHLAGRHGAYRLTTPVEALEVPASVQAVLAARLDRLPEREKEVLQTAAVIGKTFSEALLRRVAARVGALGETALDEALAALSAAEFLYEAALYPQLEYSFKHPLTQEVAERSQLRERRLRVHAAAGQALEEAGGNLDERAAEIAQHWAEAEDLGRAAPWYRRAAEWAGLSDAREGVRHWRRVRECAPGVADEQERTELALEACQQILVLAWRVGVSQEEVAAILAEGRVLAERTGDRRALAILLGTYGLVRATATYAADYVRYGEEAARIAAECDDPALRAAVMTYPAFGHWMAGDGRAVLEWSARVIAEVGSDNDMGKSIVGYSPRIGMLMARAGALLYLGRLEEAWRQVRDAERVAEEAQEIEVLGWVHTVSANLTYACGGTGTALAHGQRSLEIAEKLDNDTSRLMAHLALGYAHLAGAEPAAARDALLEYETIALGRFAGRSAFRAEVLALLAEAHCALGERPDALAVAREGIAVGSAGGCVYHEAHAHLALADALLATDDAVPRAEIEAALERAQHLVEAIAGRMLAPRILEVRGRLAKALGDAPAAERARRQALDLYRSLGAAGHAARLAKELGS